jgi:FMN-dependent oxidoreductase (nitrilotriacetate monooxygenase family)
MPAASRKLVLNAFFMRFGHHLAAWRHPSHDANGRPDADFWIGLAQQAEAAKFHTFFLADFIGRGADQLDQQSRQGQSFQFEPFTLLSAIAARTQRIGVVATVNTNFSEPYNLARQFASLDHISRGRAGWNVVSSLPEHTAANFGIENPADHGERYEQAAEFLQVSKALWDSWEDDAFDHPDRAGGNFFDPKKAHPVNHQGAHYRAKGLLDVPRPIQGYPVFVQAGNSDVGREFAAQHAEMIYASATDLDIAKAYYSDVKGRMAKYGRDESQLIVTPGLSVIVGETDQEAKNLQDELHGLIDFSKGVNLMGLDLSGYPIDGPLPDLPAGPNGRGRREQMYALARKENLTIRQLFFRFGISRGHVQAVGSVKTVADIIQQWFEERGADGFNVVPPLLPRGFSDFTRLVVPELQRRGIFHRDYEQQTYRGNLGLDRPANQHVARRASGATSAA